MPHDMKGKKLKVGDKVTVPCEVTEIQADEEYCNVTLKTAKPMYPGDQPTLIVVNAKQVRKTDKKD